MDKYFDKKTFFTVAIVFLIVLVLLWLHHMYMPSSTLPAGAPAGSITQAQYNALNATQQAGYTMAPAGGYYVTKAN